MNEEFLAWLEYGTIVVIEPVHDDPERSVNLWRFQWDDRFKPAPPAE